MNFVNIESARHAVARIFLATLCCVGTGTATAEDDLALMLEAEASKIGTQQVEQRPADFQAREHRMGEELSQRSRVNYMMYQRLSEVNRRVLVELYAESGDLGEVESALRQMNRQRSK